MKGNGKLLSKSIAFIPRSSKEDQENAFEFIYSWVIISSNLHLEEYRTTSTLINHPIINILFGFPRLLHVFTFKYCAYWTWYEKLTNEIIAVTRCPLIHPYHMVKTFTLRTIEYIVTHNHINNFHLIAKW